MSHLSPSQTAELRQELERQLEKLTRSMAATDEAAKPVILDQTAVGRLSRMDSILSQGIARGLQEREAARFAQIHHALDRMAKGTYGRCTACGGDIAFGRLQVFPESQSCGGCGS